MLSVHVSKELGSVDVWIIIDAHSICLCTPKNWFFQIWESRTGFTIRVEEKI